MSAGSISSIKAWFIIVPVVAVAAFWLGYRLRPEQTGELRAEDIPANTRQRSTMRAVADDAPQFRKARPVTNGRPANDRFGVPPFEPGGSRDWLVLEAKRAGWKDDPTTLYRMIRQYSAMDEASVKELVETLFETQRLRNAGDPAALMLFPKQELFVKYNLFPALFRLSELNPQEALDVIGNDGDLMESDAFQAAFANFTNLDPEQAIARAKSLEGPARRNAIEAILGTLFATDSERVIQILEDFPEQEFDGERRKVVERLVAENPQRAIDYAAGLVGNGSDPAILQHALGSWIQLAPESAKKWLDAYTGPEAEHLKAVSHE